MSTKIGRMHYEPYCASNIAEWVSKSCSREDLPSMLAGDKCLPLLVPETGEALNCDKQMQVTAINKAIGRITQIQAREKHSKSLAEIFCPFRTSNRLYRHPAEWSSRSMASACDTLVIYKRSAARKTLPNENWEHQTENIALKAMLRL